MEHTVTRIVLVEDDAEDAILVRKMLERESVERDRFHLEHATALRQGLDWIAKGEVDVVLLDLHLPDSDGIETVSRVREVDPRVPIVVFTVAGNEEMAVRALRAGAQDYLVKDQLGPGPVLHRAIRYAIERVRIGEEKRRLQERLLQAEKLESLGVLAAGAGFGFNTLLGTILEHADRALEAPRDKGLVQRSLNEIRRSTLRAAQLASQLRDYARAEREAMGRVDLSALVVQASELLDIVAGNKVDLDYELAKNPPAIQANAAELRHLLVNLVINAVEAIPGRQGSIRIMTGSTWASRELLAETQGASDPREGSYAFLKVVDSGSGVDPRASDRLFDPFFTTKLAGRGLGLSAAFGIARRHGGVIHVKPAPPQGTAFTVLFPAAADGG